MLAQIEPWIVLLIGVALMTVIMLRITYRRLGKQRRDKNDAPFIQSARSTAHAQTPRLNTATEIDRKEIEMFEITRELTGQLDSKIVIVQQLIADCDVRIQRLQELLDEAHKKQSE